MCDNIEIGLRRRDSAICARKLSIEITSDTRRLASINSGLELQRYYRSNCIQGFAKDTLSKYGRDNTIFRVSGVIFQVEWRGDGLK